MTPLYDKTQAPASSIAQIPTPRPPRLVPTSHHSRHAALLIHNSAFAIRNSAITRHVLLRDACAPGDPIHGESERSVMKKGYETNPKTRPGAVKNVVSRETTNPVKPKKQETPGTLVLARGAISTAQSDQNRARKEAVFARHDAAAWTIVLLPRIGNATLRCTAMCRCR